MTLWAKQISFGYRNGEPVLRDVTLEVRPGQILGLFGPNGSGKSTLSRCLAGELRPQAGRVLLDGQPVERFTPRRLARKIAVVPQHSTQNAPFTAAEMVMLGRYAHWNFWGQETDEDHEVVADCLRRIGVAHLAQRSFNELSGGERQRVIIARALAQEADVLLLDEPATHLDIAHQLELYELVKGLAAEDYAVLMVCHDILVAPLFVDCVCLLNSGVIHAAGPATDTLTPENIEAVFGCSVRISWDGTRSVSAALPE